jgi:hypothetical protein
VIAQAIGRCFELRVLAQPGKLAISSDSGGWTTTATAVEVHSMPDFHREMMHGVNAAGFAQTLQSCLDGARAGGAQNLPAVEPRPTPALDIVAR